VTDTTLTLPPSTTDAAKALRAGFSPERELTALQEAMVSDEPNLMFRTYRNPYEWMPLEDEEGAIKAIEALAPGNWWCNIMRTTWDYDHDTWKYSTIEILAESDDRVYVCGDVNAGDDAFWYWSSWDGTTVTEPRKKTTIGPDHFQATIWEQQCVTLDDAYAQLHAGLHAVPTITRQAPGFLWLSRQIHDADQNTHIRRPITAAMLE
jgi:hypothetical protein